MQHYCVAVKGSVKLNVLPDEVISQGMTKNRNELIPRNNGRLCFSVGVNPLLLQMRVCFLTFIFKKGFDE